MIMEELLNLSGANTSEPVSNGCKEVPFVELALLEDWWSRASPLPRLPVLSKKSLFYERNHYFSAEASLLTWSPAGPGGDTQNSIFQRMTLLLNSPLTPSSRDKLLIITARFVLQECGATIYGGFLRDWLIRNEQASDIDCYLPASKNFASLPVQAFATKWGLTATLIQARTLKTGDFLTTVKFSVTSNPTIQAEVDIVEKKSGLPKIRCDADVNNIQLRCNSENHPILEQTTTGAVGYSLNDTLDSILKKQFNFFEDFGFNASYAAKRALKLLNKGYNCVSGIPAAQSSHFPQHQSQIQFS